jgi:hypothetical protein
MNKKQLFVAALVALFASTTAQAQYDLPISSGSQQRSAGGLKVPAAPGDADPRPVYKFALRPDYGPWMVAVKTFRGQTPGDQRVKELAEDFASWLRQECKVNAYIYERSWEQRQQRKKEKEEYLSAARAHYERLGEEVPEFYKKVRMVMIPDEYTVVVAPARGILKDFDSAADFAKQVRSFPTPPAEFSDAVVISDSNLARKAGNHVNPFLTALPGPNPSIPKTPTGFQRPKADAFLMNLNSEESYSLLHKTKKDWTLVVRVYGIGPGTVVRDNGAVASTTSNGEALERAALQARQTAELLRKLKIAPDAYVMHTRYNSVLCVGEFDSPTDPRLKEVTENLKNFELKDQRSGKAVDKLLPQPQPMMIPRP